MDSKIIRTRLKDKGISLRGLAGMIGRNVSTVSQVIDGTYPGKESTRIEILQKVDLILRDMADLNNILYSNIELSHKIFFNAMKSRKFKTSESEIILNVLKKLEDYRANNSKQKKLKERTPSD